MSDGALRLMVCTRSQRVIGAPNESTVCPEHGEGVGCLRVYAPAEQLTDPRELGGSIAGPGDHRSEGAFIIDSRRAILMDTLEVVKVDHPADDLVAVLASGRINRSEDRASAMFLGDLDMLASFITEAHGLAQRMGKHSELFALCQARWARMPS